MGKYVCTGELPWVVFVEMDLSDDRHRNGAVCDLGAKIIEYQFLVRRMESESRGEVELCNGVSGSLDHLFLVWF